MKDKIKVYFENQKLYINSNLDLKEFILEYNSREYPVIGVKINNEIVSYDEKIKDNSKIEFLYANDSDGNKIYKSGLKHILIVAINELYGKSTQVFFEHSIDKGICFTIRHDSILDDEDLKKIKRKMKQIINADLPLKKINVTKKDAINYYQNVNELEKARIIQGVLDKFVIMYKLKDNYNYFYTEMSYSTKCINKFDIVYLGTNKFVLLFPVISADYEIPKYNHYPLNMRAFSEYKKWISSLNIAYVADVNRMVSHNTIADFIRTNELYLQKNILKEAEKIYTRENVKLVLIAGPTSSGKTTTSRKLALALKAYGLKIFTISLDDYYLNQSQMPSDAVKNRDFESIKLLDTKLLNNHLKKLVNHEKVVLPKYNFSLGVKEYNSPAVSIDDKTIIILEGNHALNPTLLENLASNNIYKIYVSPFSPLAIDRHNHLSTIDLRLIRRIVRDNQFRSVSVEETLKSWQLVRNGEEEFIFPFMKDVDSVLNTSLIYEIGVLKVYVEPLLYSVPVTSDMYEEAKRLIEFLKIFYPIPSEYVEKSSLLREFIGGSIFK